MNALFHAKWRPFYIIYSIRNSVVDRWHTASVILGFSLFFMSPPVHPDHWPAAMVLQYS